jgi:flagellar protein FlaG
MANDISVGNSSYSQNVSPVTKPRPVSSDSSEIAAIQVSLQPVQSIQTTGEMKKAELSGDHLTLGDVQMIKAIERANKALEGRSTSFEFSIHKKTKQISIKVLDKDTGEVIREIPPEKTLDMVAKMWEMAGILVDERR